MGCLKHLLERTLCVLRFRNKATNPAAFYAANYADLKMLVNSELHEMRNWIGPKVNLDAWWKKQFEQLPIRNNQWLIHTSCSLYGCMLRKSKKILSLHWCSLLWNPRTAAVSVSEPLGTNWAVPVPKLLLKSPTTPKLLLRPCFQLGNNGKNNTVLCYVVTHRLKALYKTVCSR